ncbi:hypothetical protein GCM10027185_31120 [Spirosoma pulveris]
MAIAYRLLESTYIEMGELLIGLVAMVSLSLLSVLVYALKNKESAHSRKDKNITKPIGVFK